MKYIESSIRHQYISLNSRKNAVDNSVIASVDEIDFDQMSLSSNDEYPELLISDLHSVLQPSELTLLSQFVFKGMSIADIAEKSGVSRQAINRKKQRFTRGYNRYKETSGLIEWKECQIFHSIFT